MLSQHFCFSLSPKSYLSSFMLLHTIPLKYNYDNIPNNKCVLYYDSTVECHAQEYTIFSALAVCVLVIFILFPTVLLIVYPTRLFRRCVSCCGFRRWHALHMFMESFQGQYKDGTNGTHDFRMMSALFLVFRIVILFQFIIHLYTQGTRCTTNLVCASCIHAITRPYKLNFMNNVDIVILVLLEILIFVTSSSGSPLLTTLKTTYIILGTTLLLLIPHMVLIFFIWHKLAKKTGITKCLKRMCKTLKRCMQATRSTSEAKADVEASHHRRTHSC